MARLGKVLENVALIHLYLFGIAVQCLHFLEEYLAGFQRAYPPILGMAPWSDRFFVSLNLIALAVFILAALGLLMQVRVAYVVIWFFAIAVTANGIVHPALSLRKGGYFPGTITAPIHLLVGVTLLAKLRKAERGNRKTPA